MRVAFIAPLPFSLAFGGLEVQLLRTTEALAALGVEVHLLDPWKRHLDADLVHCFGSEYHLGELVAYIAGKGIPIVVSAIFSPKKPRGRFLAWKHIHRVVPMKTSFGLRRQVLRTADAVIALTRHEAADLTRIFGIDPAKTHIIPNGVDDRFLTATPAEFETRYQMRDFVVCAASVERCKNQLFLIEALAEAGLPLVLVGPERMKERDYAQAVAVRLERAPGMRWIGAIPHESSLLASAYAAAKVHVLPSLVEAQPIAALEAAAAGANLVLSDFPHLREAFGAYAWYCDPRSIGSIRNAVLEAYRAPRGIRYTQRPPWLISWNEVARRVRRVYEDVVAARS